MVLARIQRRRGREVDVADEASTKAMAGVVVARWGRIDVLVNNAGIFYDLDQRDHSLAYLKHVLEVNMIGQWLCIRAVFPTMRAQQKGKIINQSSGAA
jgi:NAD(P)-dependent dehydrogenase (short-subunit alcohol dehydrogenase family)